MTQIKPGQYLESQTINGKINYVEKCGNMFLVREGLTILKMTSDESEARSYYKQRVSLLKGGENNTMSEQDKARETANSLRAETQEKEEAEKKELAKVKSDLAAIAANKPLAERYNAAAGVGIANLSGGSWPFLKIYAAGKSSTVLADGKRPADGAFVYMPTKQQIDEPAVRILTVSRKFESLSQPDKDGKTRIIKTQILGGLLLDGLQPKPFLFLVSGKRLPELWKFGKELQAIRTEMKAKGVAVPMFALTVNLSSEEEKNEEYGGYTWMLRMAIDRSNETGVTLIQDVEEFDFTEQSVAKLEMLIDSFIEAYEIKDGESEQVITGEKADDVPPPNEQ